MPTTEFEEYPANRCEPRTDCLICSKEYFSYGRIINPNYILLEYGIRECGIREGITFLSSELINQVGNKISKIDFAKWRDRDDELFEGQLTEGMKINLIENEQIIAKYYIDDFRKNQKL